MPRLNRDYLFQRTAKINLATVGKLSNITKDLAANQQFAQIDWTFAAGNTK